MAYIPSDPIMLLSYINTQLRDNYGSFAALCDDLDVSAKDIESKLAAVDYHYDKEKNQFK